MNKRQKRALYESIMAKVAVEVKNAINEADAEAVDETWGNTLRAAALSAGMALGGGHASAANAYEPEPAKKVMAANPKTVDADEGDFEYIVVFKPASSDKVLFCEDPQVGNEDYINLGRGAKQFTNAMDAVEYLMDNGYKFKQQVGDAEKYILYKIVPAAE